MNAKNVAISISLEQVCNDLLSNCNLISKNIVDEALADIRADIQTPDSDETKSLICRAITEAWGKVKYQAQRYLTSGRSVDDNSLERIATYGDVTMCRKIIDGMHGESYFSNSEIVTIDHGKPSGIITLDAGKHLLIAVPAGISFDVYDDAGDILISNRQIQDADIEYYASAYVYNGVYFDEFCFPSGLSRVTVTFDDSAFTQKYEKLDLLLRIPNFNLGVTDALKSAIHKFMVDYVTYRFLRDLNTEKAGEYKESAEDEQENIRKCLNSRERLYMRRASWL